MCTMTTLNSDKLVLRKTAKQSQQSKTSILIVIFTAKHFSNIFLSKTVHYRIAALGEQGVEAIPWQNYYSRSA